MEGVVVVWKPWSFMHASAQKQMQIEHFTFATTKVNKIAL